MDAIDTLLAAALAEVGYLEKATNDRLYEFEANAGSGNFTKYARELDAAEGFYNGPKNGYPWCDVFVDWCFYKCFGPAAARAMLCQPEHSAGAGCTFSARYYQRRGRFTGTPQRGAQIFFGSAAECTHTGLVVSFDGARVHTVEGNTSCASAVVPNGGAVCLKSYPADYSGIYGYGLPDYSLADAPDGERDEVAYATPAGPTASTAPTVAVALPQLSSGCKGAAVAAMQALLALRGFPVGPDGADGEFGPNTLSALLSLQRARGFETDGECAAGSWGALLRGWGA